MWTGRIKKINKPKDRAAVIIKSEEQKEKRGKENEQRLKNLWDTIKRTSIGTVGVERRERERNRTYLKK